MSYINPDSIKPLFKKEIKFNVLNSKITAIFTKDNNGLFENAIAFTIPPKDNLECDIVFNLSEKIPITTITHEIIHAIRYVCFPIISELQLSGQDEVLPWYTHYALGEILTFCSDNKIKLCNVEEV